MSISYVRDIYRHVQLRLQTIYYDGIKIINKWANQPCAEGNRETSKVAREMSKHTIDAGVLGSANSRIKAKILTLLSDHIGRKVFSLERKKNSIYIKCK